MSNLNKNDLIEAMASAASISNKEAEIAINTFTDRVVATLKDGGKVTIPNFGNFEVSERSARSGRNPATGETIQIPASRGAKFKAGKKFKDTLNS